MSQNAEYFLRLNSDDGTICQVGGDALLAGMACVSKNLLPSTHDEIFGAVGYGQELAAAGTNIQTIDDPEGGGGGLFGPDLPIVEFPGAGGLRGRRVNDFDFGNVFVETDSTYRINFYNSALEEVVPPLESGVGLHLVSSYIA